jgi:signal transduction histidine kinase
VAAEFSTLDGRLAAQAALAWFAGSLVIVVALGWAFRRLDRANRELRARSEDLQRANRELVLAAKTSALGAVTAHLIHALKNPLAGLEVFVAGQAEPGSRAEKGEELAAASELTRRLRSMVNSVVAVLHDEQHGAHFELTGDEVAEMALAKVRPAAAARGVKLATGTALAETLPGRRANLAGLVLQNLLQNAVEASPAGGTVRLGGRAAAGSVEFSVEDSGPGLPEAVRARLFQPCTSTKLGGSGIGLALSHQLAQQAGGRIELVRSDVNGTCFRLVLSREV